MVYIKILFAFDLKHIQPPPDAKPIKNNLVYTMAQRHSA
jgi:hypothetical protein